jgi:hypothetical protein
MAQPPRGAGIERKRLIVIGRRNDTKQLITEGKASSGAQAILDHFVHRTTFK